MDSKWTLLREFIDFLAMNKFLIIMEDKCSLLSKTVEKVHWNGGFGCFPEEPDGNRYNLVHTTAGNCQNRNFTSRFPALSSICPWKTCLQCLPKVVDWQSSPGQPSGKSQPPRVISTAVKRLIYKHQPRPQTSNRHRNTLQKFRKIFRMAKTGLPFSTPFQYGRASINHPPWSKVTLRSFGNLCCEFGARNRRAGIRTVWKSASSGCRHSCKFQMRRSAPSPLPPPSSVCL